jgi:hypothetical protein
MGNAAGDVFNVCCRWERMTNSVMPASGRGGTTRHLVVEPPKISRCHSDGEQSRTVSVS